MIGYAVPLSTVVIHPVEGGYLIVASPNPEPPQMTIDGMADMMRGTYSGPRVIVCSGIHEAMATVERLLESIKSKKEDPTP